MNYLPLVILSVFFVRPLYRYISEVLCLKKLMSSGTMAQATVTNKERIEGPKQTVRYVVTYEFQNFRGEPEVHQRELRKNFFSYI